MTSVAKQPLIYFSDGVQKAAHSRLVVIFFLSILFSFPRPGSTAKGPIDDDNPPLAYEIFYFISSRATAFTAFPRSFAFTGKAKSLVPFAFYSNICCSTYWLRFLASLQEEDHDVYTSRPPHTWLGSGSASVCLLACFCDQAERYLSGNQHEAKKDRTDLVIWRLDIASCSCSSSSSSSSSFAPRPAHQRDLALNAFTKPAELNEMTFCAIVRFSVETRVSEFLCMEQDLMTMMMAIFLLLTRCENWEGAVSW